MIREILAKQIQKYSGQQYRSGVQLQINMQHYLLKNAVQQEQQRSQMVQVHLLISISVISLLYLVLV
jgi:hypothetical protein